MIPSLRRTLFNVGSIWINKVVTILVSFLITGIATRYYGLDTMGLWLLATNAAAYVMLFDFGAASALPRILPALHVQKRHDELNSLVRTTYLASWGVALLGLAAVLIGVVLAYEGALPFSDRPFHETVIYALAFGFGFVGLPYRAGFGLLASMHRFDLFSWIEMAGGVLKLLSVALTIYLLQSGLTAYAIASLVPPFLATLYQYRLGLRLNAVSLKDGQFSKKSLYAVLAHCGPSLIITFSTMLLIQGSTLLAGSEQAASAAIYGYPLQLVISAMSFSVSIGALLSPVASALHGGKDYDRIAKLTLRSTRLSGALSVGLALVLLTAGPWLIRLWLEGPKVSEEQLRDMTLIMQALAVGSVLHAPANMIKSMLLGMEKQRLAALLELFGTLVGLAAGWVLMDVFSMGAYGLVIGVTISYALRGMILFPLAGSRSAALSYSRILIDGLLKPCLVGTLAFFTSHTITGTLLSSSPSFVNAVVGCTVAISIWSSGIWLFVLDNDSKELVRARLSQRLERIKPIR